MTINLSTQGDGVFIGTDVGDTVSEKMWISSIEMTWAVDAATAGEGPIIVYVAHSDYTDAEIDAYIELIANWDTGDLVAREQMRRFVRQIGVFPLIESNEVLNDGRPVRTKCGWMLETGQTLQFGAYTQGGALTGSTKLHGLGKANAWLR